MKNVNVTLKVILLTAMIIALVNVSSLSAGAKKRIAEKWVGKKKLSKTEIQKDEFLSAAAKFGDTVIKHGRDVYGPKHTPVFVTYLNRELLKSPAKIPAMRVNQGCSPTPTVDMNFDNSQNLFRGLVALSQCTGDPKYAEAVMEAMLYIRDNLYTPETGLFPMGAHTGFDLITERAYCDNRPYVCIELNGIYPFYEFFHDVDPEFTSRLVKGIWEAFLIDWHGMTYNRHAPVTKKPDFAKTWQRPLTKVENLPNRITGSYAGNLGYIAAAYDLAFSGYTIGLLDNDPNARKWAMRMFDVINYFRDPKTKIWPMGLYSPYFRRGLQVYRRAFPKSNPTEPRVIISSWIHGMPSKFFGPLGVIEQAVKSGKTEETAAIHKKVDENILGYMRAAYDREKGMRSIILDGTDVTDYKFTPGNTLHGWGSRAGHSFDHLKPPTGFHTAIARAWRLTQSDAAKKEYWGILRDLFRGAGLGDIGESEKAQPALDLTTKSARQAYIFALADIYRVNKNSQVLKMMERLGRNIIAGRQDAKSGLFVVEADRTNDIGEPIKGVKPKFTTVRESVRSKRERVVLDYDRPKVVTLDVTEPLALLTVHACRTGQFDKIPMVLNPGGPSGMINHQLEIWFDRAKMKKFYADNPKRLLGNTITEKWYTSQLLQVDVVPLKGTVRLPANSIPLRATVKSAGPDPAGGDYAVRWKLLEGDGQAEFSKRDKLDTWASFDRPGTYAIEVTVTGDGRMGSAGIIVEVLGSADADAPPFGEWIAGYASIDADKRGPADDPDGDGIANLLEKFFGGNPSRADAELAPRLVGEKKNRRIQFRQSKKLSAGASYVLQYRQAKDKDAWRLASGVVFRQTRELAGSTLMEAELPGWLNEERPVDFRFAVIEPDVNYAPRAKVSVSSAHSRDYAGSKAVDGIKGIRGNGEWCAALDKATPWIQLDWPKPVSIRMVHLFDRPNPVDHTRTGTLTFSDGSSIGVADIANNGSMKRIVFDPKTVTWVRFQVTGGSGRNRGLDEIEALSYPILKAHSATLRTVPR